MLGGRVMSQFGLDKKGQLTFIEMDRTLEYNIKQKRMEIVYLI